MADTLVTASFVLLLILVSLALVFLMRSSPSSPVSAPIASAAPVTPMVDDIYRTSTLQVRPVDALNTISLPASPSAGISTTEIITQGAKITSPSPSADLQTVLNYILARGTTLDGTGISSDMRTALTSQTAWETRGGSPISYYYRSGINTLSSYIAYYDNASGAWNIRSGQ